MPENQPHPANNNTPGDESATPSFGHLLGAAHVFEDPIDGFETRPSDLDIAVGAGSIGSLSEAASRVEDATQQASAWIIEEDNPDQWLQQTGRTRERAKGLVRSLVEARIEEMHSLSMLRDALPAAPSGPSRMDRAIRSAKRVLETIDRLERDLRSELEEERGTDFNDLIGRAA